MLGGGGHYESSLLGGAATRRLITVSPIAVVALGGYGYYGEEVPQATRRDASGILFGGAVNINLGSLSVALLATDMTGTYDGSDITPPFRFHAVRYSLGIGVTVGR
jgi:hypothetical protein